MDRMNHPTQQALRLHTPNPIIININDPTQQALPLHPIKVIMNNNNHPTQQVQLQDKLAKLEVAQKGNLINHKARNKVLKEDVKHRHEVSYYQIKIMYNNYFFYIFYAIYLVSFILLSQSYFI
jgi:hypothetical protein